MKIAQLTVQASLALNATESTIHHCVSPTTRQLQQQISRDKRKDDGFIWRKERLPSHTVQL